MGTFQNRVDLMRRQAEDVLQVPPPDGSFVSEAQALTSIARSAILIEHQLAAISSTLRDIQLGLERR
jgi:hypothetical protein